MDILLSSGCTSKPGWMCGMWVTSLCRIWAVWSTGTRPHVLRISHQPGASTAGAMARSTTGRRTHSWGSPVAGRMGWRILLPPPGGLSLAPPPPGTRDLTRSHVPGVMHVRAVMSPQRLAASPSAAPPTATLVMCGCGVRTGLWSVLAVTSTSAAVS